MIGKIFWKFDEDLTWYGREKVSPRWVGGGGGRWVSVVGGFSLSLRIGLSRSTVFTFPSRLVSTLCSDESWWPFHYVWSQHLPEHIPHIFEEYSTPSVWKTSDLLLFISTSSNLWIFTAWLHCPWLKVFHNLNEGFIEVDEISKCLRVSWVPGTSDIDGRQA